MKYIQCRHCEKKYTASDKLCAAVGKEIRCKDCQQVFEIIIHDDQVRIEQDSAPSTTAEEKTTTVNTEKAREAPSVDDAAPLNTSTEQEEDLPDSNNSPEENSDSVKKKFNVHLLISITLGLTLLAIATVAYLFFYQNEIFQPSQKQDAKQIIPDELIKPVSIQFPQKNLVTGSEKSKQEPAQPAPRPQKAKSLLDGPDNPSQVCKDSAADYWFRSRLIVTVQLDTATYLELLNQNLEQVEEMRRLCKDKQLITRITEAAKTGQIPAWINTEIESRSKAPPAQKESQETP